MSKYIIISLVLLSIIGCNKDNSTPINMGYHYFPTEEGRFVVYDVLTVLHDDAVSVHDTSEYQIKEVIGESFLDDEGDKSQKLYRFIRESDTLEWLVKDVWQIKLTTKKAEVVEENKRRIKMGFAISYNQYWDCNALNEDLNEECYYAKITDPFVLNNGIEIDSTVIIEHSDFLTFIDYLRSYEVYAAGIGKIYAYQKDFTINNSDTLNPIKGYESFYSMVNHGVE